MPCLSYFSYAHNYRKPATRLSNQKVGSCLVPWMKPLTLGEEPMFIEEFWDLFGSFFAAALGIFTKLAILDWKMEND